MNDMFPRVAAALIALTLLAGCSDNDSNDSPGQPGAPATPQQNTPPVVLSPPLAQQISQVNFPSFDGTPIAMTLFQPALAAGESAPVLLYSHGWGGRRSQDLAEGDILTRVARRAWQSGYFVITFDARGFGASGGEVNLQDPALEGRDIQAVIDWAQANFPEHIATQDDDPLIAALGASYAGGGQLIGAAIDPRLDAVIPAVTWHDLSYSLAPNTVPKTLWQNYLFAAGAATGTLAPWLNDLQSQAWSTSVAPEALTRLTNNGLGSYCAGQRADGAGTPKVDAFFIQGVNDTLFNANEAIRNFECLRTAGNDAYLLVARGGHLLPEQQDSPPNDFDTEVQCGATRYNLGDMAWNFLEGKLRNRQELLALPRTCFVANDTTGLAAEQVTRGGAVFTAQATIEVGPPQVGAILNRVTEVELEEAQDYLRRLPLDLRNQVLNALVGLEDHATLEPSVPVLVQAMPNRMLDRLREQLAFIPLHTASAGQILAGVPLANLQVQADASLDPRFFMGIGVQRAGSSTPQLLHDQVLPIRGAGTIATELVAVSTALAPGDQVGVLLFRFHPLFASGYSRTTSSVTVNGSVELPLQ